MTDWKSLWLVRDMLKPEDQALKAANITAKSNKELGKKLESVAKEEIKSKDRVDISLEEYLSMRKRIEELESKNSQRDKLIIQLGIPAEVIDAIRSDTIKVAHCDDIRDYKRTYRIEFDVDASPDLMRWRYEYDR